MWEASEHDLSLSLSHYMCRRACQPLMLSAVMQTKSGKSHLLLYSLSRSGSPEDQEGTPPLSHARSYAELAGRLA